MLGNFMMVKFCDYGGHIRVGGIVLSLVNKALGK